MTLTCTGCGNLFDGKEPPVNDKDPTFCGATCSELYYTKPKKTRVETPFAERRPEGFVCRKVGMLGT